MKPSNMNADPASRDHEKLMKLATFDNATDAHRLRAELENQGIRATVSNELSAQSIGVSLFGRIAAISIEVHVLEADLQRAIQIKNSYLDIQKNTNIPEWICPCGETVDAGFATCWACGADFPETP